MPAAAKPASGTVGTDGTNGSIPPLAWAGVIVAAVIGSVARFAVDSPLWLDEALSVNIADLPIGEIPAALRHDGHPPLYYWLLHGWMGMVGDGDRAVRSLSAVLGVAALPLVWMLGRRLGGALVAAWSVVLLALLPYAVRYSSEARMYSLVMVLVLAGGVLILDGLRSPTWPRLLGIGVVCAALVLTQYWSLYLLASLAGVLAWRWRRHGGDGGTARVLAAVVAGGAAFVAWLPVFLDQAAHTGTPWALPARPAQIVTETITELGTGGVDEFAEGLLLGVVLAVLVAVGVLGHREGSLTRLSSTAEPGIREVAVVAFATMALGAVIGRVTGSAFSSRYAAVVVPLLVVLAASGLTKLPPRWPAVGAGVAVVLLGGAGLLKVDRTDRTEAAAIAAVITADQGDGDVVVACPDQLGVSLDRALHDAGSAVPVVPYPEIDRDPRFVDWRDYTDRNDAADPAAVADTVATRATGAVWVAWNGSYRSFEGDCEALIDALSVRRGAPASARPTPIDPDFEHADLLRFGPP